MNGSSSPSDNRRGQDLKGCGPFRLRGRSVAPIASALVWAFVSYPSFAEPLSVPQNLRIVERSQIIGLGANVLGNAINRGLTLDLAPHSIRVAFAHGDHDFNVAFAAQNGIGVVFMLGYGEGCQPTTQAGRQCYADRSAGLAQKYGDKAQYYEVWNEWNGNFGPYGGFQENNKRFREYTDLLCKTHKAIKAVRPSAKVAGGVIGGANPEFLTGMLDSGAGDCMDVLSLHIYPYRRDWPGHVAEDAPGSVGAAKLVQVVNDRQALVRLKLGRNIPIIITETGLPVENFPESLMADYLTELYKQAANLPFLEGVWWYYLRDHVRVSGEVSKSGLVRLDGTKRPAFESFKSAARN